MDNRINIIYSSNCLQHPLYFIGPLLFLDKHYTPLVFFVSSLGLLASLFLYGKSFHL